MSATRVSKGIISKPTRPLSSSRPSQVRNSFVPIDRKRLNNAEIVDGCQFSSRNRAFLSPLVTRQRTPGFCLFGSQLSSDCDVGSSDVEEEEALSRGGHSYVKRELLMLSLPAIGGQALEPLTQLMETAYIGRLGPVELGSAGVSTNIFNYVSKLFNIPLLSVATSFVAEDISKNSIKGSASGERKQLSSVSTALLLAVGIGIIEALALYLGSGKFLDLMGVSSDSSMRIPAQQFLSLRALGAPAVVVSLALQGVFRGFKDTKTPCFMSRQVLCFNECCGFLLGRTLAVLTTMTLGTSMAARQGPVAMAAHQICIQVWMAVSLLTDALAASAQAMVATSLSKGDYQNVRDITDYVLKIGLFTGVILSAILGVSFGSLATLFTKDAEVLGIVKTGVLFVSASQPLNALAYIFDGLHYGISDFPYAAGSMMLVGAICSALFALCSFNYGPSRDLVGLDSLYGPTDGGRICEITIKKWSMVVPAQGLPEN
uniref:Protein DETOXIFICATION n=1 Tax=Fagus sylvatica TaxID=28930 RepID=A0A2N9G4K8_FAGSY